MSIYSGPRRPRWRYLLLDHDDDAIGELESVTGGSLTVTADSRLGGSGQITLDEAGQGIDWMNHRIQFVYDPGIVGVEPWPFATMMLTSPTETHLPGGRISYTSALLSKMKIVDEDTVATVFGLDVGTNIVDAATELLESTGETLIQATPSMLDLAAPMVWDAGTPKLTIINDLLTAAGYWGLWCDAGGWFRIEPWAKPTERQKAYEFIAGEDSLHAPEWSRDQDLSSVPNRCLAIGRGDQDAPPLVGDARNEDPESRFSYQARGDRWITRVETGVEAAGQEELDTIAMRHLLDAMSPVAHLEVQHALVPVEANDLVWFTPSSGETRLATVQSMKVDLRFDTQVAATWREVTVFNA